MRSIPLPVEGVTVTTQDDPRHYDWPRHEVRHLIATLPDLPRGWLRGQRSR